MILVRSVSSLILGRVPLQFVLHFTREKWQAYLEVRVIVAGYAQGGIIRGIRKQSRQNGGTCVNDTFGGRARQGDTMREKARAVVLQVVPYESQESGAPERAHSAAFAPDSINLRLGL